MPDAPALEFRGIAKRFGGVRALRGVSFSVAGGEVHAVLGANGAGKSTLLKILAGLMAPDEGEILLDGRPLRVRSPREAHERGIGLVPQETTLFGNLSIAENLFLGRGWSPPGAMAREARRRLAELGLEVDPFLPVDRLSVARKQLVQIARALAFEPRLLALDEPTASLSEGEAEALFGVLRGLRARGVTMLFVSHRLKEVRAVADRATVLRDGEVAGTLRFPEASREEVVRLLTGAAAAPEEATAAPARRADGPAVLEARGLGGRGFRGLSFSLRRGEVLGWFGLVGAGRTEAARALFGIDPAEEGEIFVEGRPARVRSPREAVALGLGLVPEDRKLEGLVLSMTVAENLTLASLPRLGRWGAISPAADRAAVEEAAARLRLKCAGPDQPVSELSGGNQQKVVLGRWLATRPRVLILDEPTKGVDVGAKAEIRALVRRLAAEGTGVILISSEIEEARDADRILVFRAGRVSAELPAAEATDAALMSAAT
jgi:ABC-type sugar transport system ATPase subunit